MELFCSVAREFGLTVSIAKTKIMTAGHGVSAEDSADIVLPLGTIEAVPKFTYLGSIVTPDSRSSSDIKRRIAEASKAFGALQKVFTDRSLSLSSKRHLYMACVSSILLYGGECWTPLQRDIRSLDKFHHQCIRTVLSITKPRQWSERLSSTDLRNRWGDPVLMSTRLRNRRLEWTGHVARMDEDRTPLQLLFGWLPVPRPFCGPRRRWKDTVMTDLKVALQQPSQWFILAQDRQQWREVRVAPQSSSTMPKSVHCAVCDRNFSRVSDRTRHKCTTQRQLPIQLQRGSVQCQNCQRWYRSKGGYSVHRCQPVTSSPTPTVSLSVPLSACCQQHCPTCQRCFRSAAGFKRHNCNRGARPSAAERAALPLSCPRCKRNFRRQQDLARHSRSCL